MIIERKWMGKWIKLAQTVGYALRSPSLIKQPLKSFAHSIYSMGVLQASKIPERSIEQICDVHQEIKLKNCCRRDGNIMSFELTVIAMLIANHKPKNLLEIGTFDGNTTLQMALNAPKGATVHTIDLPRGTMPIDALDADKRYIEDKKKQCRKFEDSPPKNTIIQHFGNSMGYDFQRFIGNGLIDFCFIDGSHLYEVVQSDTKKALEILAPQGMVLWHDYNPLWTGVYRHLCELSKVRSLVHISETSLVLLQT